eukprot:11179613-Lingulodinium_polyedra.AAC.1
MLKCCLNAALVLLGCCLGATLALLRCCSGAAWVLQNCNAMLRHATPCRAILITLHAMPHQTAQFQPQYTQI